MKDNISQADLGQYTWLMQQTADNPWLGFWTCIITVILGVIVFKLGFAQKLPLLKSIIIYTMLVIGCFFLWTMEFAFGAPIMAVLAISALFLGGYRFRLHLHRKQNEQSGSQSSS
ncbi:YlaH-like family protein [Alkalicoccobacillus gibsonii]|uniref:YlaH-like family protein n=1 Tax=Alkalicoccobacillus gibsonii TaxID=79881 RepID=A0ABU9VJB8_9BACI